MKLTKEVVNKQKDVPQKKVLLFFLKNHQDIEICFLSEILLFFLLFLLFAYVWHCT